MKWTFRCLLLTLLLVVGGIATAAEPLRIDGSSAETAKASYLKMAKKLPPAQQQALGLAVLKLNLDGVQSAYQAMDRDTSIVGIRERVDGMTAEEIIALGETATGVKIEAVPAPASAH